MSLLHDTFRRLDLSRLPTPCYVVDAALLERNLQLLARVQAESGAKVLLALKGFAMFHFAPLISRYLSGVCASGLFEAKLGREYFGGEVHTFAAAYPPADMDEVLKLSDHVIFNSCNQWDRFRAQALAAAEGGVTHRVGKALARGRQGVRQGGFAARLVTREGFGHGCSEWLRGGGCYHCGAEG